MSAVPVPARSPVACGALGDYDPDRVRGMASCVDVELTEVHRDERSMLMLDRPPIAWSHGDARGFAWADAAAARAGALTSWRDAASTRGACGLVVEPDRRYVHSSIQGVTPVYHRDEGGATYFASRIDPLARLTTGRLSADWRAWSALFVLGYPLGARTPFEEIRSLPPWSRLERSGHGGDLVESESWPWAAIEPHLGIADGTGAFLDAIGSALRLPRGPVSFPLSGGWDSRLLLLCLLREGPAQAVRTFTTSIDDGRDADERLASQVAETVGVAHEVVEPAVDDFWGDLVDQAARIDYQRVGQPWEIPLSRRLRAEPGIVPLGRGGDVFFQPGGRYISRDALEARSTRELARALWPRLRRRRAPRGVLSDEVASTLIDSARRQFVAEAKALSGSPSQALLTVYRTRAPRSEPLGDELAITTPFSANEVATALLAISPREKFGARLYESVFAALDAGVDGSPSTNDRPRPRPHLARRWLSDGAVQGYEAMLRDSPLRAYFTPRFEEAVAAGGVRELLDDRQSRFGVRALVLFGLWHARYSSVLRDLDLAGSLQNRRVRRSTPAFARAPR